MLTSELITGQLIAVLREGYEGPKTPWSYFTDSGPSAGLTGSLERLTADEASKDTLGSSICSHVQHVIFGMNASAAWIRGDHTPKEWKDSWAVRTVTDDSWEKLQADLKAGFENLRQAITFHSLDSAHSLGGAIASIAHIAYHLGAIKQKMVALGS